MRRRKWDSRTKAKIVIDGLGGRPVAELCNAWQIREATQMGYIEKSLLPGEEVLYKAKIHWFILMRGLIYGVVGLIVIFYGMKISIDDPTASWGLVLTLSGFCLFVASPIIVLSALVERMTTELGVTNKRVITEVGFIRRTTIEVNHPQIESLNVDQSVLGRILGYGTISVNGSGGITAPIKFVSAPIKFRRNVMGAIDRFDN